MELNFKERLNNVKAFVFDVDGVLTDGKLYLNNGAEPGRAFYIKDEYALQQAVKNGYYVAVLTRGKNESVRDRLLYLGVHEVYMHTTDKTESFKEFLVTFDLQAENVLYMGDDLPDMPVLERCGVPTCPADAASELKSFCPYVSPFKGGNGCVRDVIEQVLRLHAKW